MGVVLGKHPGLIQGVFAKPGKNLLVHSGYPAGGIQQALPVGVLPDGQQNLPHGILNPFRIHIKTSVQCRLGKAA